MTSAPYRQRSCYISCAKEFCNPAVCCVDKDNLLAEGRTKGFLIVMTYGATVDRLGLGGAGADMPTIYETERYSMDSYKLTVPNGKYTVRLHFAETFEGVLGPGERVFSVGVPGQETLKDLDLYKTIGPLKPLSKEYKGVSVENGQCLRHT